MHAGMCCSSLRASAACERVAQVWGVGGGGAPSGNNTLVKQRALLAQNLQIILYFHALAVNVVCNYALREGKRVEIDDLALETGERLLENVDAPQNRFLHKKIVRRAELELVAAVIRR